MSAPHSEAVETARAYYNSDDADNFYNIIWGGEDIHVGLYQSDSEPIFDASRRTVEQMASELPTLPADAKILDLGSGYCGAARYLAKNLGCHVIGLNLSEVENVRARELNAAQGLGERIEVVDGSFEAIPMPDASVDVVWSQDAILHSGDRPKVIAEVARVLKPGGHFVFTDPMQADACPEGVLEPILARIHLDTLGSPGFYRAECKKHGLEEQRFNAMTHQLANHYGRVLAETERREADLKGHVSPDYITRMKSGLKNWVAGGKQGHLAWGIFHFQKR